MRAPVLSKTRPCSVTFVLPFPALAVRLPPTEPAFSTVALLVAEARTLAPVEHVSTSTTEASPPVGPLVCLVVLLRRTPLLSLQTVWSKVDALTDRKSTRLNSSH